MTIPAQPGPIATVTVPLLTAARFAELTGSATVPTSEQLYSAQRAVESFLRRGLALLERTERVLVHRDGCVYPKCTPIASVADGYAFDGPAVFGVSQFIGPDILTGREAAPYTYLTYTGGWAADTLPQPIEDALARETLARTGGMSAGLSTVGATSVHNGDVSITYAQAMPGGSITPESQSAIAGWVHREWITA